MDDIFQNSFQAETWNEIVNDGEMTQIRYQQLERLIQSIREGNEYQALETIRERCRQGVPGILTNELEELKFDLIRIQTLMCWTLRRSGAEDYYLDRINRDYVCRISSISGMDAYCGLAEEMVKDYCALNRLKDFQNYSPLVQKIIMVVDYDLRRPLTLHYFADTLNVNRSYLSDLFRREIGVTITEYVTERRITRAAYLLATTQHPIKTVAEQVGIADVHYFSRLFKKRMGQTPSEYRESRKNYL